MGRPRRPVVIEDDVVTALVRLYFFARDGDPARKYWIWYKRGEGAIDARVYSGPDWPEESDRPGYGYVSISGQQARRVPAEKWVPAVSRWLTWARRI